ncbi:CdaR family transcriptional regulator [Nocardiopsis sp. CC223A]|uniref:PucR family transcriptional regulator n=1 Tax=Nocardiopsis sp. CC223A TaxID=3044051 RepID=UPI00278BB319|nr:helix-turn-helix domain-containing protein [Nocardiopsis sp. CC223A]
MAQIDIEHVLQQSARLGVDLVAGPSTGCRISRVEIADIGSLDSLSAGTLVIADVSALPSAYRIDIAIRQASARRLGGLVLPVASPIALTSRDLAERGGVPVLQAPGRKASDLAVAIDRMVNDQASDVLTRARFALEKAREAAGGTAPDTVDAVLAATGEALGGKVRLETDPQVGWAEEAAVFIGEVPRGRLVFEPAGQDGHAGDDAAGLALPGIAAVVSKVLLREVQHRFAPRQTSAELLAQLVVAESSRVDSLADQAYRLGFPLQLSHVAAWLEFTDPGDADHHPPRALQSALELHAFELFENRDELWHIAFIRDDALIVSSERPGRGDHQRRLREVAADIADHAQTLAGGRWESTVGMGTPQVGATGLRQSAAEARIAAETAVASGRIGHIVATDVTGLRRVLLDFYASPTSRKLLEDLLRPLDSDDPQKTATAVRTLLAYLSNRNSPAKAARELLLHPNAVTYRMRKIEKALQLDLDDPDTRFAVELACRVRLLSAETR